MDTRKLKVVHMDEGQARIITQAPENKPHYWATVVPHPIDADMATELVRRWNEYPQQAERIAKLEEALADMVSTASEVESMMDGDKDKQEAWTEELGRLYVALDDARALLQTLKP